MAVLQFCQFCVFVKNSNSYGRGLMTMRRDFKLGWCRMFTCWAYDCSIESSTFPVHGLKITVTFFFICQQNCLLATAKVATNTASYFLTEWYSPSKTSHKHDETYNHSPCPYSYLVLPGGWGCGGGGRVRGRLPTYLTWGWGFGCVLHLPDHGGAFPCKKGFMSRCWLDVFECDTMGI